MIAAIRLIATAVIAVLPLLARGQSLTMLYAFGSKSNDAGNPTSALTYKGGLLYGTTYFGGGQSNLGTIFRVNAKTGAEIVLDDFIGKNGQHPDDRPVFLNGRLYGTTKYGGAYGCGVVFQVNPSTGLETVTYSFKGGADACYPYSGLLYEGGFFYGTSQNGGGTTACEYGCGSIYKINASTGAETVVYSFKAGTDGWYPWAGLIYDGGSFYGTTFHGGTSGFGTVYKFVLSTGIETVIYSFKGYPGDGAYPEAGLLYYGGRLYGTTYNGGSEETGTLFAVNPSTGAETFSHSFVGGSGDGVFPESGLTVLGAKLYGVLPGPGFGKIYSLDPTSGTESIVYSFTNQTDGANPIGALTNFDGTLFGTTNDGGGTSRFGTVFKFQP